MEKKDMLIKSNAKYNEFKEFLSNLSKDTQFTFTYFGKITTNTVNSIIKNELSRKDKIKFFMFLNDKLIAYSFLTKFEKITKKHNCILGIVVADHLQKKGYGKKICQHMINSAWKKGLKKIWLTVYSDNKAAIQMYKSLGFEIEGIFMSDEEIKRKKRHVVSMAIFKGVKSNDKERLRVWKNLKK